MKNRLFALFLAIFGHGNLLNLAVLAARNLRQIDRCKTPLSLKITINLISVKGGNNPHLRYFFLGFRCFLDFLIKQKMSMKMSVELRKKLENIHLFVEYTEAKTIAFLSGSLE